MGCSSSRETDDSPPTTERRAPTPLGAPPNTQPSAASLERLSHSSSHITTQTTATRHNVPLDPPPAYHTTARTWTPSQLARERAAFFETRVTGRAEIWGAIQVACQLLREGQTENARGVVEAAGVTLPTGNLVEGGYDTWGGLYRVPREVVTDPTNIQPDPPENEVEDGSGALDGQTVVGSVPVATGKGVGKPAWGEQGDRKASDPESEVRRDEKGKGKMVVDKDAVKVRCRLSDRGGPDVVVMLGRAQSVGVLVGRVADEADIPNTARIRIAYLGKILDERETLAASGWKEGHVLNALVVMRA